MTIKWLDMPELNRRAFAILSRELGIAETLRFFNQLGFGRGNYTEERRELLANVTMDDIRSQAEQARKEHR